MNMHIRFTISVLTIVTLGGASAAALAADAITCQTGKLKVAGKYGSCLLGAEAKAVKAGGLVDASKCDSTFATKWQDIETKTGPGICLTEGDETDIAAFILSCSDAVADSLDDGSALPACPNPANATRTGETSCSDSDALEIPCAGTGQDGELQKGLVRRFVDGGDGTITDKVTGLTWEKLSDDGTLHDKDQFFSTQDQAYTFKIDAFNAMSFAGHNDWRLPNIQELLTLTDWGSGTATYAAFTTECVSCTALDCSCTKLTGGTMAPYWSSTTSAADLDEAWVSVGFPTTVAKGGIGGAQFFARAVRGGS